MQAGKQSHGQPVAEMEVKDMSDLVQQRGKRHNSITVNPVDNQKDRDTHTRIQPYWNKRSEQQQVQKRTITRRERNPVVCSKNIQWPWFDEKQMIPNIEEMLLLQFMTIPQNIWLSLDCLYRVNYS